MDVAALTAFLSPFLPFLLKVGEMASQGAVNKFGSDAWDQAKTLWTKLRPKVEAKEAAKEAVEDVAKDPQDEDAQVALRRQIEKLLKEDPTLAREISSLFEQTKQTGSVSQVSAIASGERSVAIGGNMSGENINIGDQTTNDTSRTMNITGSTINNSGAGAFSIGDISGTVANTINQLPASPEPKEPGLKELLQQLKYAIEAEPNLSDKDKAKALKQVEVIAEAGKAPEKGAVQEAVDNAITMLKGISSGLPAAVQLVKEFHTLLPQVASLFGL